MAAADPRLRVLHLATNQGKAVGLRTAALAARSEFLVCVDGDAILDEYAAHWMMWHLTSGPRVGAVTGNPRVRNRCTLLGRLQVGEFSLDRRPDQARAAHVRPRLHRLRRDRGRSGAPRCTGSATGTTTC